MSVEFIHCNQCLIRTESRILFYLTECAKIYCQTCVQNTSTKSCPNCCPNVCQTIPLVNGIKHDIELYFKDFSYTFKNLSNVEMFQNSQRKHLLDSLFHKIKTLEQQNCQLIAQQKHLENELKKKDHELNSLKCENNGLKNAINSRINNDNNETNNNSNNNYQNNGALRQSKSDKKVTFSTIFGTNEMQSMNRTNNRFVMNDSLSRRQDTESQCLASPSLTSRSRITLSQSSSGIGDKQQLFPSQMHRKENDGFNSYTPMSINSIKSRSSATINTPFSQRSTSSVSHSSFNISPAIFGYRPSREKIVQRVNPYSPF